jgi:hypothetical protein
MEQRERDATGRDEAVVMKQREFTNAQRVEMIKRATDNRKRIICEGCGLNITGKVIEIDHTIPEAMLVPSDRLKPLTIEMGKVLGRDCCHRAPGGKTAQDLANLAEAKNRELSDLGARRPSQIKGPAFRKPPPQRRASSPLRNDKQFPPRRQI